MIQISASIIAADQSNLGQEVINTEKAGADSIHIDIMDGSFVPNITFGADVVKSIRSYTTLPFHLHLMIARPENFLESFVLAGADMIVLHIESSSNIEHSLSIIKSLGVKCGISLKPETSCKTIDKLLPKIDQVLVMTVNPGFSGQTFMENQLEKIQTISHNIQSLGKEVDLSIDGGINLKTAKLAIANGASSLVAGSYIYQDRDPKKYQQQIISLKQ